MKRRHIALFTLMGNGHINPMLPLCSELTSRGHRVTCPTINRYSKVFSNAGGEVVPYVETPVDWALRAENEAKSKISLSDSSRLDTTELEWAHFVTSSTDFLSQVCPYYENDEPDFVLYNRYCVPARVIAHRVTVPAAQLSPHFAYHGNTRYWSNGIGMNPPSLITYAEKLDAFLARLGLYDSGNLWHVEELNIHFIPREFQYQSELFDKRFLFAAGLRAREPRLAKRSRDDKRPTILVSGYSGLPETQYSNDLYFRMFVDALADTEYRCILSIGDRTSAHSLGRLPSNFEINESISHLKILPHVDLFACHGGMGSTLEALSTGVPVLAIAATPYTHEVAYRLAQLGLGTSLLLERFGAETLKDTVREMLGDPRLPERVDQMRQRIAESEGAVAAADHVDSYLARVAGSR